MSIERCSWLLPLLFAASPAAALELVMRDVHLALETLPTDFDFTYTSAGNSTRSGEDAFDSGFALSGGGRWSLAPRGSRLAGVAALDAVVGNYVYDGSGINVTTGGRLGLGLGCALSDRWIILAGASAEYGLATFELPQSAATGAIAVDGDYLGYGANLDGFFAVGERWWLQAGVGWRSLSYQLSGDGRAIDIDAAGVVFSVGAVFRYGIAPRRLE